MPAATEFLDAGGVGFTAWMAYPRFVTAEGKRTVRAQEWLDTGLMKANADIYNARSSKTRNYNKCGDGSNKNGLGNGGENTIDYKACPYLFGTYTDIEGEGTTINTDICTLDRYETDCVITEDSDGDEQIVLSSYATCQQKFEFDGEVAQSRTIDVLCNDQVYAFIEECGPTGFTYEQIECDPAEATQYEFQSSENSVYRVIYENTQSTEAVVGWSTNLQNLKVYLGTAKASASAFSMSFAVLLSLFALLY